MSDRPWHLHNENMRAFVLDTLDENVAEQWWTNDVRAAYEAAAALLRAAEPDYPDDCPAFETCGAHVEVVGIADHGPLLMLHVAETGLTVMMHTANLRPLTIAAADLLAALEAGAR